MSNKRDDASMGKSWRARRLNTIGAAGIAGVLLAGSATSEARTLVVDQQHRDAANDNPGTAERPLKSINAAAQIAEAGDTVLVHAGIYREWVTPMRGGEPDSPITYQAAEPGQVIVRGSERYTGTWEPVEGEPDTWRTQLDPDLFTDRDYKPFAMRVSRHRGHGTQGQVFFNGRLLAQDGTDKRLPDDAGSWEVSDDGLTLSLRLPEGAPNPNEATVELSVRMRVFAPRSRGLGHIHVRGFVFEHAANRIAVPQMGMVSTRSGHGWVIENNVIRFARGIGLECGAEWGINDMPFEEDKRNGHDGVIPHTGGHLIRNNIVSDNEQCGIAGLRSYDTRIVGNIVERNGAGVPGYESGGIKVHLFYDGVIEGNLVRDNEAYGIWLDNDCAGGRVTRNLVINNTPNGIFLELLGADRPGMLADNNVILANRGDGIYAHDASRITAVHNLIFDNTRRGIYIHVATNRGPGAEQEYLYNNLLIGNVEGEISLPLPGGKTADNESDRNVFSIADGHQPRFIVNPNNGAEDRPDGDRLSAEARRAFEATGDPGLADSQIELLEGRAPALNLDQWRAMMNHDRASLTGELRATLDPETLALTLTVDESPSQLQTLPYEFVEVDYLGAAIPAEGRLPGPFQNLQRGENRFNLWPVPGCGEPSIEPPGPDDR
ncbi:MAG: right-handed parallel beta-helix repeat-containing protein [Phycisphaeraceae bacterium]